MHAEGLCKIGGCCNGSCDELILLASRDDLLRLLEGLIEKLVLAAKQMRARCDVNKDTMISLLDEG